MATLYITDLLDLHIGPGGKGWQMLVMPPITKQTVSIGGSSTQSKHSAH